MSGTIASDVSDIRRAKEVASDRFLTNKTRMPRFATLGLMALRQDAAPDINVHAVGIGRKEVMGGAVAELSVRLYVARKMPLGLLSPDQVLPRSIDGIPTDVIESLPARFAALPQREGMRPVLPGASIAHPSIGAGTLGAICRREPDDGERLGLSNNHVFAALGQAAVGDAIVQPGPLDVVPGGIAGQVGQLASFVPISGTARNRIDAALVAFSQGHGAAHTDIIGLGPIGSPLATAEQLSVVKSGRTTGVTRGVVVDIDYDLQVPLGPGVMAVFEDTIRVDARDGMVADLGDSGSLFVTEDTERRPVGLLFATPPGGGYAVACKLSHILSELGAVPV